MNPTTETVSFTVPAGTTTKIQMIAEMIGCSADDICAELFWFLRSRGPADVLETLNDTGLMDSAGHRTQLALAIARAFGNQDWSKFEGLARAIGALTPADERGNTVLDRKTLVAS